MEKYEYVQSVIEKSSATFYQAFKELPEQKRKAIFSIYAFCKKAIDAVNVEQDVEIIKDLRKNLTAMREGNMPDDPIFETLKETFDNFPNEEAPYKTFLDGLEEDLNEREIKTDEDLEDYAYKVAGTVGLMVIPIVASEAFNKASKPLKDVAIELGKAMKITNILRNVRDDLIRRRIYFPNEAIEQHDVKVETLRTGIVTAEYRSLVETYIDLAKNKYQMFYDNVQLFDKDSIEPLYIATRLYEGILDEIRKGNYTNITKKHNVSTLRKWFLMRKIKKELKDKGVS